MKEATRFKRLKVFLRIYGVMTLLIFTILSVGFLLQWQAFNPGGAMHWLIWDDLTGHVGPMLFAVYLVWGIFFLVAANNPPKYRSFLTFTMWANLAHGLVMIPMALGHSHMYLSKFLTDIPFILGLSVGLYLLRQKSVGAV